MRCYSGPQAKPWPNAIARTVVALVAFPVPATAASPAAQNLTLPGNKDFILQVDAGDRWARLAVHAAIGGAFRRLAAPECRRVLSDFTDGSGRMLRERLEATGQTAQEYLGLLRYADGSANAPCTQAGVLAFTSPGTRIIYVCARFRDRFLTMRREDREDLEIAVLHEVLHTLGLGENPPTPLRITEQVRVRCAR